MLNYIIYKYFEINLREWMKKLYRLILYMIKIKAELNNDVKKCGISLVNIVIQAATMESKKTRQISQK